MMRERKFLLCNDKVVREADLLQYRTCHVLGEVVYAEMEGQRVTVFSLFDKVYEVHDVPDVCDVRVERFICGDGIKCICGSKAKWDIGKAAFAVLESRYTK